MNKSGFRGESFLDKSLPKLKLDSFNNLTKTLSFNIYDICYARSFEAQKEYIAYVDEAYNSQRLTQILTDVAGIIGASILNIACQDYDPAGASAAMLVSEFQGKIPLDKSEHPGSLPEAVVAHMDKSHLTAHTYPERHPDSGISTFRADIDISTCGKISPLKALNFLIHSFDSDIVIADYRVRGFTRDTDGKKHYNDQEINSIQSFMDVETLERYQATDVNVYQENIFHTKMMLKKFELKDYLFAMDEIDLSENEQRTVARRLRQEMTEIFYGRNIG